MTARLRAARAAKTRWPHPAASFAFAALAVGLWAALLQGCAADPAKLKVSISTPEADQSIGVGNAVEFEAAVKGGESPVTVEWDFDSEGVGGADPDSSNDLSPGSVNFSNVGDYVVIVTATDDALQTAEATVTVTASYESFVSSFKAVSGDTTITLSWTDPSNPDYDSVLVRRDTSGYPVNETSGVPVGTNPLTSPYTDPALTNGTLYYYSAFAYNSSAEFGSGVNAQATPADVTAPGDVTDFTVTAGSGTISLSWSNPTDLDFQGTLIQYSMSGCPQFATDGSNLYDNTGTSTTHSSLTAGDKYYYTAFTYDEVPNYSAGVCKSATVQ